MNKRIIHTVFEKVASIFPQHIAVEEEYASITFDALNKQANQMASLLRDLGLDREQVVATMLPSGIKLISALLGIFKAGGIYMPMGATMSEKRFSQVLTKGAPKIMIVSKDQRERVLELIGTLKLNIDNLLILEDDKVFLLTFEGLSLKEEVLELGSYSAENMPVINASTDGNYIFYTSGSTGTPKAILGCHDSLSHFVHWEKKEFEIDDTCRVSQLTAITFDASLRDIFLPLCTGGTLCIPSEKVKSNLLKLVEWLESKSVTLVHCVPSLLRSLSKILPEKEAEKTPLEKLKNILLAGEMLYNKDIQYWRSKVGTHVEIVNLYGATESTMIKTFHRIGEISDNPAAIVHVGKPISNTVIAIMNEDLCSTGEIGKVYIKTPFLSKGYYKDPALTRKVFVQNPLVKDKEDILYYTGDLGRYLDSGEVEILGREDNQVKVNGIRVELAEVEQAVLSLEGVLEAVVIPHMNKDNLTELVCYFTGAVKEREDIVALLQKELNQGTVPSYFFHLEEMPLNINGKIDKKNLPKPSSLLIEERDFQEVKGEYEQKIEKIWKEVLGIERIGRKASFFNIGGSSLKAIQMISRIYKEFNVMILVRDIFSAPTIGQLALKLKEMKQGSSYNDIALLPRQVHYDLSHAQKRLWVLNQFGEVGHAYNMHQAFVLKGPLDLDVFRQVINDIVARHEALRTTFLLVGEAPKQKIHDFDGFEFELGFLDFRNNEDEKTINEHLKSASETNFDLEKGPLINASLIQKGDELFIFSFTIHHIIGDAWSIEVLINEVFQLYSAYVQKEKNPLPPLKIQYKEYAAWQNDLFDNGADLNKSKNYWFNKLSDDLPILALPTDYPRPVTKTFNGDAVIQWMSEELGQKLIAFSQDRQASLFMVLLSAANALIYRYTGQKDIVIGTPVAGRDYDGLENQVGFYINNLVLRTEFEGIDSFKTLIENVKRNTLDAFDHQVYPFDRLVQDLNIQRDTSRSPLFDVALVLQNADVEKQTNKIEGLTIESYNVEHSTSTMDIRMVFEEGPKGLFMMFEFNNDLFDKRTINTMMDHFVRLVDLAITNPDKEIAQLDYLTDDEEKKLVYEINDTAYTPEQLVCVHQVFEKQAQDTPTASAILLREKVMTYAQVNEEANYLAYHLRNHCHVMPNDIVGLMAYTNEYTIIAILAIMKAGAAYLPIDPDLPQSRKDYILADAKIMLLLTEGELIGNLMSTYQGEVFALDLQWEGLDKHPDNLPLVNKASDLAYIIYTSGSTGKPKGVCITHESQVNMSNYQVRRFQITAKDNVLQFASLSFDASVSELFMAFYAGAALVLKDKSLVFQTDDFVQYLQKMEVSVATFPPSFLSTLPLGKLQFLRAIVTAGEAAKVSDLSFLSQYMQCFNAYGPTECAVCVSTYKVSPEDKDRTTIPIGRPIANTQLYVLDDQLRPVPKGVTGMIYIGGKGLAKSYLYQDQLTQNSFINNPFEAGKKMYITGDLGKWDSEENLIFIGRADRQVKVNGFRVELGEIESCLIGHGQIKDAFLTARKDQSGKYQDIIAYYVAAKELSYAEIRDYLGQYLPEYMLPSYFISLNELPLNNNGKVAEELLPQPEVNLSQRTTYRKPQDELQKTLVKLWEKVLDKEKIGIDDNFFELGGHSLKATQILASIRGEYHVKLGLGGFFQKPTIAAISQLIKEMDSDSTDDIVPVPEQSYYETTNAQRRLWVLNQFDANGTAYNLPVILEVNGLLNITALSDAFLALVSRQESLRTTFALLDGVLKQKIHPAEEWPLPFEHIDLRSKEKAPDLIEQIKVDLAEQLFDLEQGPLLKASLVSLEEGKYILTFNIHHIIADEWSMAIIVKEWLILYTTIHQGKESGLANLNIQYKDFAAWQNQQIYAPEWSQHKAYWTEQYQVPAPKLDLPTTYTRPEVKSTHGDAATIVLESDLALQLVTLGKSESTSLFMGLCTSVYAFLYKYTGQNDIVIGTPMTLRDHEELQGQVGLYLNLLALRMKVDSEDSFVSLLRNTQKNILNAFAHQAYPFDQLVEDLALPRDMNRSPLFDVMVVLHDNESEKNAMPKVDGLTIDALNTATNSSRYDLTFNFREVAEGIQLNVEYCTDLFSKQKIEQLLLHYRSLLQQLLKYTDSQIGKVEYLTAIEKEKLLIKYNNTTSDFPATKTLVHLFEEQVELVPDSIAFQFENIDLSYDRLNRLSNQMGHYLNDHLAIGKGDVVCLLMDRSEQMMVVLLGVLKSGAAYVPIDTDYPQARVDFILKDTNSRLIITDQELAKKLDGKNYLCISPSDWPVISTFPEDNLAIKPTAEDLAYIIYTSGSTGKPKGVMIEQQGVVNRLDWMWRHYEFTREDVILQKTPYVFDVSVWELFMPLLFGARLVMCRQEVIYDLKQLTTCIAQYGITTMHFVPSMLQVFLQGLETEFQVELNSLKRVISSGEALSAPTVQYFHQKINAELHNLYGPTEASIDVSHYTTHADDQKIPIGEPIANMRMYILDENGNLVPEGVLGEIGLAGVGLARGYLNRPLLTSNSFVSLDLGVSTIEKVYLSGDLGYWTTEGMIVYQGRKDRQIKLFGQRLELAEIENVLMKHGSISTARIKMHQEKSQDDFLVAYWVGTAEIAPLALRTYLLDYLPSYMIPSYFVHLEEMPLTKNGKLDEHLLVLTTDVITANQVPYEAPANEIENQLVKLWQETLQKEQVGVEDNFFDVGGNSLRLIIVHQKLQILFPHIKVTDLFKYTSIRELSRYLGAEKENEVMEGIEV